MNHQLTSGTIRTADHVGGGPWTQPQVIARGAGLGYFSVASANGSLEITYAADNHLFVSLRQGVGMWSTPQQVTGSTSDGSESYSGTCRAGEIAAATQTTFFAGCAGSTVLQLMPDGSWSIPVPALTEIIASPGGAVGYSAGPGMTSAATLLPNGSWGSTTDLGKWDVLTGTVDASGTAALVLSGDKGLALAVAQPGGAWALHVLPGSGTFNAKVILNGQISPTVVGNGRGEIVLLWPCLRSGNATTVRVCGTTWASGHGFHDRVLSTTGIANAGDTTAQFRLLSDGKGAVVAVISGDTTIFATAVSAAGIWQRWASLATTPVYDPAIAASDMNGNVWIASQTWNLRPGNACDLRGKCSFALRVTHWSRGRLAGHPTLLDETPEIETLQTTNGNRQISHQFPHISIYALQGGAPFVGNGHGKIYTYTSGHWTSVSSAVWVLSDGIQAISGAILCGPGADYYSLAAVHSLSCSNIP